jgi:RND family efflux transporter MFP subunit
MKKLAIILVITIAGGYWGFLKWRDWQAATGEGKDGDRPTSATVIVTNITFAINAAGDIGPADQVSVRSEINGRIATLNVDLGDKVSKGSVLFTLDDRDLQIERASRLTEIEGAKLQVERAQRNYERSQQLFKDKLISLELFQDTQTDYELARNALDRAQKSLDLIEDRLTKTKILAPFDCTVLTRPVSVGQAVSGSGGFNSGTEVLTVANLNEMIINAHINQADVIRLSPEQEVDIEVEAVAGLRLSGVIERIAPQATIKNGIKGFATRILLKNLDPRVRPGMTANLSIPVAAANQVLAVPLSAIFTEQGERYVLVKNSNGVERRSVQISVADFFYVEVQQGLKEGEVVMLEPPPAQTTKIASADAVSSAPRISGLFGSTNRLPQGTNPPPASAGRVTGSSGAR